MSPRIVEATSIEDYLSRYYKPERLRNVDDAYGNGTLLSYYQIEFDCYGFVCTSHHDNITGEFIAWPKYAPEEITDEARELSLELRRKNTQRIDSAKELGRKGGLVTSEKKAQAVRENGKKGGRPAKNKGLDGWEKYR